MGVQNLVLAHSPVSSNRLVWCWEATQLTIAQFSSKKNKEKAFYLFCASVVVATVWVGIRRFVVGAGSFPSP